MHNESFSAFWDEYPAGPRKVGRRKCEAKWEKRGLHQIRDVIMFGLRAWKRSEAWQGRNGAYIPLVETWLNQDRWEAAHDLTPAAAILQAEATVVYLAQLESDRAASLASGGAAMERLREAKAKILAARLGNRL